MYVQENTAYIRFSTVHCFKHSVGLGTCSLRKDLLYREFQIQIDAMKEMKRITYMGRRQSRKQ